MERMRIWTSPKGWQNRHILLFQGFFLPLSQREWSRGGIFIQFWGWFSSSPKLSCHSITPHTGRAKCPTRLLYRKLNTKKKKSLESPHPSPRTSGSYWLCFTSKALERPNISKQTDRNSSCRICHTDSLWIIWIPHSCQCFSHEKSPGITSSSFISRFIH